MYTKKKKIIKTPWGSIIIINNKDLAYIVHMYIVQDTDTKYLCKMLIQNTKYRHRIQYKNAGQEYLITQCLGYKYRFAQNSIYRVQDKENKQKEDIDMLSLRDLFKRFV